MMSLSIGPFKKAMGTNFIAFSKDASIQYMGSLLSFAL